MKKIALLGCTGSIGQQVINVAMRYPERFSIVAMAANRGSKLFFEQVNLIKPRLAVLHDKNSESGECPSSTRFCKGEEAFEEACTFAEADIIFVAVSGFAGLKAALLALEAGKDVALANKECLVAGGDLVNRAAEKTGAEILPVDSEHSAIWQALGFDRKKKFKKIILTASGGALRDVPIDQLPYCTAKDALAHPNWKMGDKITIDCATMLNKGFEVMEAMQLYGAPLEKIETVIHRESIIHSMVAFEDGSVLAQMSNPSMEIPIQLALTYPDRLDSGVAPLDFQAVGSLHFSEPEPKRYPCFTLALECAKAGGNLPCALVGAGEAAVAAFLKGKIKFTQIAEIIESALSGIARGDAEEYSVLKETYDTAVGKAENCVLRFGG